MLFRSGFGMRTYKEISQLQWSDIKLWPKVGGNPAFLEITTRRATKMDYTQDNRSDSRRNRYLYDCQGDMSPVKLYNMFSEHRPLSSKGPDSPFFLRIRQLQNYSNRRVWFTDTKLGKPTIDGFMKSLASEIPELQHLNLTNYSLRVFTINYLMKDCNLNPVLVSQHAGQTSVVSVTSYTGRFREINFQQFKSSIGSWFRK